MSKKIEELKQAKKEYPPELIEEMQEIMRQLSINGEEVRRQLKDAEQELADRRRNGEDI